MIETLRGLDILMHIDDLLKKIQQALEHLEYAKFKANLQKCFFMQKEVKYLGYFTRDSFVVHCQRRLSQWIECWYQVVVNSYVGSFLRSIFIKTSSNKEVTYIIL